MPIKVPVVQTGLEASIQAAAKKAGKAMKIDMGAGAKSIEGLSQPLGRITGKADQFTKSMEAANARVLAFGASVGVLSAVSRGFQELVKTTIEVEKRLTSINSILGGTGAQLQKFKKEIFDVAKNTEQSFETVSEAALELSRQGLKAEVVVERLNDSLILARLSGLGASEAVFGLTAAINSFRKEGISSAEVLNKLSAAAISAAVSEKDLIEGIKRSGSVATQAGVSFNELIGVITAVQERTARGGAVIGNSFKTIFTRIQSIEKLETMQNLGVQVTDAGGQVLGATKLIENLAKTLATLPDAKRLQIAENLVGKFQIAPFLAILEDYNSATSTAIRVTEVAAGATSEAYQRNIAISKTLSHAINETVLSVKELADTLGKIGVTDSLRNILDFFSNLTSNINKVLEGDTLGSKFAKGIVKGIGGVLSGPGLAIFGAIIAKLTLDLAKFGLGSLKTFFGLNKAARDQVTLQGQIASTLLGNKGIQAQIMAIENSTLSIEQKRAAQTRFFTTALNEQLAVMTRMQAIAARVAPGVMAGTRGRGRGAGGYIPNFNATMGYGSEQADINRGVGGAPKGARPITVPNFNFGGGQRGAMVANSSEYIVPNFGGGSGSAIFNQDMVSSMGLPAGARKIGAAGGFIPNFASRKQKAASLQQFNKGGKNFALITAKRGPDKLGRLIYVSDNDDKKGGETFSIQPTTNSFGAVSVPTFQIPPKGRSRRAGSLDIDKVAGTISKYSTNKAVENAKLLSGRNDMPRPLQKKFIESQLNVGSVKGMAGTIFEASLTALLSDQKFKDVQAMTSTSLVDLPKSPLLYNAFGIPVGMAGMGVEVKGTGSTELIKDAARKFYQVEAQGKRAFTFKKGTIQSQTIGTKGSALLASAGNKRGATRNTLFGDLTPNQRRTIIAGGGRTGSAGAGLAFAGGYIPNFASPLEDAINREQAAGLPISQIRINQDSGLRGAGNPMGLAVTNMRDEPTGAIPFAGGYIPNYQLTSHFPASAARPNLAGTSGARASQFNIGAVNKQFTAGAVAGSSPKPQRDLLGPIFAVTAAMSALQGATSGAEDGLAKFTNIAAKALSGMTTAVFAGTAIKGFATDMAASNNKLTAGFGKLLGPLATAGMAVGIAAATFKGITSVVEQATGVTAANTLAMDKLTDAADQAAIKLSDLGAVETSRVGLQTDRLTLELFNRASKGFLGFGQGQDPSKDPEISIKASIFEALKPVIIATKAAGISDEKILETIRKEARGGAKAPIVSQADFEEVTFIEQLDADEMNKVVDTLLRARKETIEWAEAFEDLTKAQEDAILSFANLNRVEGGGGMIPPQVQANITGDVQEFRDELAKLGVKEGDAQILIMERVAKTILEKRKQATKEAADHEKRIAASIAKEKIRHAIAMLKAEKGVLEQIDLQILASTQRGNLTKEQLRDLKIERKEIEANLILRNATAEAAGKIVSQSEELTFKYKDKEAILTKLNALVEKGAATEEDRAQVIAMAKKLIEESTGAVKAQLEPILNNLTEEEKRLTNAREFFGLQQQITTEVEKQRMALDIIGFQSTGAGAAQSGTRQLNIQEDINRREQQIRARQGGGRSANEQKALAVLDAQDRRFIAGRRNDLATETREQGQRAQLSKLGERVVGGIGDPKVAERLFRELTEELNSATGKQIGEIGKNLKVLGETWVPDFGRFEDKFGKLSTEIDNATSGFITQNNAAKEVAAANIEAADAAITLAGKLGDLSFSQIIDNMERALTTPEAVAQRRVNRLLSTNPAERLKMGISEGNVEAKAAALAKRSEGGLIEFREILEQEEFSGKLIDASYQFAQNIGAAMVDAVARGEDLKGVLTSAATTFFNTLSQAYMSKAVDQIVDGGGGFLGSLFGARAGGGLITGGSGNRDDVPTLLTGGEFVIRKSAVEKYGAGFFEGLNTGGVGQMARGGLYSPGTYGQGAISGKKNLLDFATQSFTGGQFDQIRGGAGFGSVALEPQSGALTHFGRGRKRFQDEQRSKEQAFGLYVQQINAEQAAKEARDQRKKGLIGSMIAAVGAAGLNTLVGGPKAIGGKSIDPSMRRPVSFNSNQGGGGFFGGIGRALGGVGRGLSSVFSGGGNAGAPRSSNDIMSELNAWWSGPYNRSGNYVEQLANKPGSYFRGLDDAQRADLDRRYGNLAAGGYVSPTAGVDTVPSMLSGGEFVMNAAATQRMGRGNLAALNSGGGGEGGDGAIVTAINNLGDELGGSGETVINITVNSDGTESQDTQGGQEDQQNLATKIKDVVRATIDEEKRLGGSLRRV